MWSPTFHRDFTYIAPVAAQLLADAGVQLVATKTCRRLAGPAARRGSARIAHRPQEPSSEYTHARADHCTCDGARARAAVSGPRLTAEAVVEGRCEQCTNHGTDNGAADEEWLHRARRGHDGGSVEAIREITGRTHARIASRRHDARRD
jgi:hypothetical protein